MNLPPALVIAHIQTGPEKSLRLWLPILILWPVFIVLFALVMPFALIAEVILYTKKIRPLSLLLATISLLGSVRGTSVEVAPKGSGNHGKFSFHLY